MDNYHIYKKLPVMACILTAAVVGEIIREQKTFKKTTYVVISEGKAAKGRILFLSDMHCKVYGKKNEKLLAMIRNSKPDLILIGGDMVIGSKPELMGRSLEFLKEIASIAPVYYGFGNHEVKCVERPEMYGTEIYSYLQRVRELGITILDNKSEIVKIRNRKIRVIGFSSGWEYYRRRGSRHVTTEDITGAIGEKPMDDIYTILLAHSPEGDKAYREWGADMTLCGHYHGGVIRFGHYGVITPQFHIFSRKCYGCYCEKNHTMIVTSGLGTHTLPLRLMNPAEFVEIHLL